MLGVEYDSLAQPPEERNKIDIVVSDSNSEFEYKNKLHPVRKPPEDPKKPVITPADVKPTINLTEAKDPPKKDPKQTAKVKLDLQSDGVSTKKPGHKFMEIETEKVLGDDIKTSKPLILGGAKAKNPDVTYSLP
jgi:hypothetical protein